ncbi:catenin delta-2 [Platysternon megacephalum]|uniref:Peroxisomal trans-2-enoyl-CoA reductase n=1 Tax=Platysternon megacephalum TaxID=55544 RepID=A0A4D9E8U5_9SAUR|nr:catenin delta-2 [Platysternon megacephalum]
MAVQGRGARCGVLAAGLFRNQVAIVTGGGTGIGKAITADLLGLGCNVVIASRKLDRLQAAAKELAAKISSSNPVKVTPIQCNIRREEEKPCSDIKMCFHLVNYLEDSCSVKVWKFLSWTGDRESKGWHTENRTILMLSRLFSSPHTVYNAWMREHGGAIVNIVADMWKGFPGMSHTGAARAAVDNLTKSLAIEWAHSGVRINSVAPGVIFSETAVANYKELGEEMFKNYIQKIPAKRLGIPEEIITGGLQHQKETIPRHSERCFLARLHQSCEDMRLYPIPNGNADNLTLTFAL